MKLSVVVLLVLLSASVSAFTFSNITVHAAGYASPPQSICDPVVETNIAGEFNGWDSETIYKMDNGQIWQQSNYHYHYHYAYHPSVLIYPVKTGCHIKVDGDDDSGVDVVRLK